MQPPYSTVIPWSNGDHAYIVSCPEWEAHGLIGRTHGNTYAEAVRNGQDVLHMLVESACAEGDPLPERMPSLRQSRLATRNPALWRKLRS